MRIIAASLFRGFLQLGPVRAAFVTLSAWPARFSAFPLRTKSVACPGALEVYLASRACSKELSVTRWDSARVFVAQAWTARRSDQMSVLASVSSANSLGHCSHGQGVRPEVAVVPLPVDS